MSEINAQTIAELRAKTGAGMMDCKKAMDEVGSVSSPQAAIEKAVQICRMLAPGSAIVPRVGVGAVNRGAMKLISQGRQPLEGTGCW